MSFMKKLIAAGLAVIMGAGLAACHTGTATKWIAKSGDMEIPAGIYINMLYSQYYTVTDKLSAEDGQLPEKPLNEKLDGVPVSEVIAEEAKKDLNKYIVSELKFDEMELTLPDTDIEQIDMMVESYWPYIGSSYTMNGVSKESYTQSVISEAKKNQIFSAIYGEGGTEAVSESELKEKYEKDVAKVMIIPLQFSTAEDETEKKEADDKTRAKVDEYFKALESGKDMEEVYFQARKDTSSDPESLEQPEKGASYSFIIRDTSTYDENVTEAIFNAPLGKPVKAEGTDAAYVFVRYSANENAEDFTSRKSTLVNLLRTDAFDEKLQEWVSTASISYNDDAFKRYTPSKLKMSA